MKIGTATRSGKTAVMRSRKGESVAQAKARLSKKGWKFEMEDSYKIFDDGTVEFFWGGKSSPKAAKKRGKGLLATLGSYLGIGGKPKTGKKGKATPGLGARAWAGLKSLVGKAPGAIASAMETKNEMEANLAGAIWGEEGKAFVKQTQDPFGLREEEEDYEDYEDEEYEDEEYEDEPFEEEEEFEEFVEYEGEDEDVEYDQTTLVYDQHLDIPLEAVLSDDDILPIWDKRYFEHMGEHKPIGLYYDQRTDKYEFFWGAIAAAAVPLISQGLAMGKSLYEQRKARKARRRERKRRQAEEFAELQAQKAEMEERRRLAIRQAQLRAQQAAERRRMEAEYEEEYEDDYEDDDYEDDFEDDWGDDYEDDWEYDLDPTFDQCPCGPQCECK
jgi:hypothetical protein